VLAQVRPNGLEDAPQLQIDIDRDKAQALGVGFDAINSSLSTALGSSYVNDFPNRGRLQRVVVQADAPARMQPEDLLRLTAPNKQSQPVPLSAFATTRWVKGAQQTVRYNGYPSMRIEGAPAPGYSTGDAMAEMERLAAQLPEGFGFEWTGQSREEKQAGSQALIVYAFAILAVFLCLAALYESWTVPLSVMLAVPIGVLGALLFTTTRGLTNDVYFQVGLLTTVGLAAKNAILIVEFAVQLQERGKSVFDATVEAVRLRLRPILMTSLAFGFGVTPLVFGTGAGAGGRNAIGTAVLGGTVMSTVLGIFMVPIFFLLVRSWFKSHSRHEGDATMANAGAPEVSA
jgi:multidrug efflux pump